MYASPLKATSQLSRSARPRTRSSAQNSASAADVAHDTSGFVGSLVLVAAEAIGLGGAA